MDTVATTAVRCIWHLCVVKDPSPVFHPNSYDLHLS